MNIEVKRGTLKHLSGRGFGFIQTVENGIFLDIFFHVSSIIGGQPTAGATAEFNDGVAKGRRVAVNVRFISSEVPKTAVTIDDCLSGLGSPSPAIQVLAEKTGAERAQ
jgi:cold shock CspA family protein